MLTPTSEGFDNKTIYHGDILVDNGNVYIWYSGVSTENRYSIGLVKGKVKDNTLCSLRSDNIAENSLH
jgi:GH43 family beta-xylosidase